MPNFICPLQDNEGHRKLARQDPDKENRISSIKDVSQSIKGGRGSIPSSDKPSSRSKAAVTPPKAAGGLGREGEVVEELSVFEEIMNEVGLAASWMDDDSDGDDIQL